VRGFFVIPAKTGIQKRHALRLSLDTGFRRYDALDRASAPHAVAS